jgi:hypothetical protein
MTSCKNYSYIEGLSIDIEPCFYNYFTDIGEFHCTAAKSVMNTQCINIKTNKNVGLDGKGPKFCDNAQLLFKINGESGLGCEWDENYDKCVDVISHNNDLPVYCSEYNSSESCNYHMIRDGSFCFWNSVKNNENENFCIAVTDVKTCDEICSNDISGINTYFCDGNIITMDSRSEMCKWGVVSEETVSDDCNCEGIEIPESCSLLNVTSPLQCKNFTSNRGNCFYNGNKEDEISGLGVCSDIVDVTECEYLLGRSLCTYAKKHSYYNLENYSSASREIFLCFWNMEREGGMCESKQLNNLVNENNPKISILLIIIIVVLALVLIAGVVVVVLIVKKVKSHKNHKKREHEMNATSSSSLNDLIAPGNDLDYTFGFEYIFSF